MADCSNAAKNLARCTCSYTACTTRPTCCDCLAKHLANRQLPGCCFPAEAEKSFDRSFENFARAWNL